MRRGNLIRSRRTSSAILQLALRAECINREKPVEQESKRRAPKGERSRQYQLHDPKEIIA